MEQSHDELVDILYNRCYSNSLISSYNLNTLNRALQIFDLFESKIYFFDSDEVTYIVTYLYCSNVKNSISSIIKKTKILQKYKKFEIENSNYSDLKKLLEQDYSRCYNNYLYYLSIIIFISISIIYFLQKYQYISNTINTITLIIFFVIINTILATSFFRKIVIKSILSLFEL